MPGSGEIGALHGQVKCSHARPYNFCAASHAAFLLQMRCEAKFNRDTDIIYRKRAIFLAHVVMHDQKQARL